MSLTRIVIYTVACFIGLCVLFFILLRLLFWEPSVFTQGSIVHWWTIPSHVDEAILWDVCRDPIYDYKIRDGEHPEIIGISYGVSTINQSFDAQLDQFAEQQNCEFIERAENKASLSCQSEDLFQVHTWVEINNNECRQLQVDVFTGN